MNNYIMLFFNRNKRILFLLILLAFTLIYIVFNFITFKDDEYQLPEDAPTWEVSIFCSSLYPVTIQKIHAINITKDWTKILMGSGDGIWLTRSSQIKEIFPNYKGYGIPLYFKFASVFNQPDYSDELPEIIYIYWTSISNTRFFITQLKIDKEFVNNMKTKIYFERGKSSCYPSNIDFGLLPDGSAKVWLSCAGRYRYIGKIGYSKELKEDSNGHGPEDYKEEQQKIKERANYFGVNLFPIPIDKIDKTYIYKYKSDE